MKALQIIEGNRLELVEMDMPSISPHHVLLKVMAVSICGTDVHQWEGKTPTPLPRIPGHDFSGIVEEVGPAVDGFKAGDRVAVRPSLPCYICRACAAGFYEACPNTKLMGLFSDGCFREYMAIPESNLISLPDNVTFEAASVLEPFTVGLNAFRKLSINIGETIAVLGAGPIGLGVIRIAGIAGAGRVYAIDVRSEALEIAREFGATDVIDLSTEEGRNAYDELKARKTDIVIETAGASATVAMIPGLVRKEGRIVNIGIVQGIGAVPTEEIVRFALTVIGVGGNGGKGKYVTALDLAARGIIDPERLITHTFPFEKAIEAFEVARDKPGGTIKVAVVAQA